MKTALLHYWLTCVRGGEKVLAALAEIYPDAPIYTHAYFSRGMGGLFEGRIVRESFIASLPCGRRRPQAYLPLMPLASRRFDLGEFDLVVSSESGPVKGIRKRAGQRHICYCHTPMRYLWDMQSDYYRAASFAGKCAMKLFTPYLRREDLKSAESVDVFVANSRFVAERIKRIYARDAAVVHPPVAVPPHLPPAPPQKDFYLVAGQLVPYKRADVAVDACIRAGRKLVVAGAGPMEMALRKRAAGCANIVFTGRVCDGELWRLYAGARALLFPGIEDFGIVPVEAQAAGTPVIAFGVGGALETVQDGATGIFFHAQTPESLANAMEEFESRVFQPGACRASAARFAPEKFAAAFREIARF